jgi:acetyl esterase/lipase
MYRELVSEARTDRHVLYFHGGGYAFGTESLVRYFTGFSAQRRPPLYYTSTTDLLMSIRCPLWSRSLPRCFWLAARINPDRIAFFGDLAGSGLLSATLHKMRDEGFELPSAAVALSPWTDLALTGQSLHSNAGSDPLMDVKRLPAYAQRYEASLCVSALRGRIGTSAAAHPEQQ